MSLQDVTNQRREITMNDEAKKVINLAKCEECKGLNELIFIIEVALADVANENSKLMNRHAELFYEYEQSLRICEDLDSEIQNIRKVN